MTASERTSTSIASEYTLTSIEICAGAGGQAIGLHSAGFRHLALVEIDKHAVETLKENVRSRDGWEWERKYCDIFSGDVNDFEPIPVEGDSDSGLKKAVEFFGGRPLARGDLHLLAGGVPCPPFSHAGKQLGSEDERDLFPRMLQLVDGLLPEAVMIENVRGIKDAKFGDYRTYIEARLQGGVAKRPGSDVEETFEGMGYKVCMWDVLEAANFGVPQLRPRAILVAIRKDVLGDLEFVRPVPAEADRVSVFKALEVSMRERFQHYIDLGGADAPLAQQRLNVWLAEASKVAEESKSGGVAPTLVGGSKKHGGADLGPSRAKAAWAALGVSGLGVANGKKEGQEKRDKSRLRDLLGPDGPMLTVEQAALIQGFPPEWEFTGGKTAQYRQVGNAFPPPVAEAVASAIAAVLRKAHARDARVRSALKAPSRLPGQVSSAIADSVGDLECTAV